MWTGDELKSQGIVDRHYGALARRAVHEDPAALELDDATKTKFESTFGIKWDDAVTEKKVCNMTEALKRLPSLTDLTMAAAWRAGGSVKLMPGTYVAKVDDLFVVNGFYADMVSTWKQSSSRVLFYLVTWKEDNLSWADFRGKIIGSTDPEKAEASSIRGTLLHEYDSRFKLEQKPTTSLNGVHASAGPIEGARECQIWGKMKESHVFILDQFARRAKVPADVWKSAMDNVKVDLPSGKKGLIFDVTEGMSGQQALDLLKEIASSKL